MPGPAAQSSRIDGRRREFIRSISHSMLYRSHQARIYGFWRGGLLWPIDPTNSRLPPSIRLD